MTILFSRAEVNELKKLIRKQKYDSINNFQLNNEIKSFDNFYNVIYKISRY